MAKKVDVKKDIRLRVYLAFTCICLFGLAIVLQAGKIIFVDGDILRSNATEIQTKQDTIAAERGNIYTEEGILLSTSIPEFDVHIDFPAIDSSLFEKNIDSLSICMSLLFKDKSWQEYKEDYIAAYNNDRWHYPVGKKLKYYQYEALRNFPILKKGKSRGGFIVETINKRTNPYEKLAYRTIGIFRENNKTGLEGAYDNYLTGEYGHRTLRKSAGNVWVTVEGTEADPKNGKDIITTIDINMQDIAEHALQKVLEKYECTYGACIVMEVKTGKIRSMVNLSRQKDGSYWEDMNYALSPTEPGSTFKLATLISLLNDKKISVEDNIDAEGGVIRFGSALMKDSHLGLHTLPVWKAFALSSNAAFAKLAFTYYKEQPKQFTNHLKDLYLSKKTGIDLPGERAPVLVTPEQKEWSGSSLPWMAIGYGVQITPMHTCMLYNAIANNGKMVKPYLVSAIREYGKDVKVFEPTVLIDKICDNSVLAQLNKCLQAVITEGTGKEIQSHNYSIAGKTGTAKVAEGNKKYTTNVYQGSFVGFIPAEDPKYTICVVVRTQPNPKVYYGGAIAAPVFRMVADKIFSSNIGSWKAPLDSFAKNSVNRLPSKMATGESYQVLLHGINKSATYNKEYATEMTLLKTDSLKRITLEQTPMYKNIAPNVSGMGLKDAIYILENSGLQVQVRGKGRVTAQSIEPGSRITKGQNIIIQLS